MCNGGERYVIERLVESVASRFDYPGASEIQVLTIPPTKTQQWASRGVAPFAAPGPSNPLHLSRQTPGGYKAGALENGLKRRKASFWRYSTPTLFLLPIFFVAASLTFEE